jgi:hypothetical protein
MANEFKSVLTLTADSSGVTAGVNQAMASLNKLQGGMSALTSLAGVGFAIGVGKQLFGAANDEMARIKDLAHSFSPEGMQGANALNMATQQSDMAIGKAFGPIVEAIDQASVAAIKELTTFIIEHKDEIGMAMIYLTEVTHVAAQAMAEFLVGLGKTVEWLHNWMDNPVAATAQLAGDIAMQGSGANLVIGIYDLLKAKLGGT